MGAALEAASQGADSRQEVAERIVGLLFEGLRGGPALNGGEGDGPACALVRCFQTCPYARLPLHLRDAADELLEQAPSHPHMRCLTLLATRGTRLVWNDVMTSVHHQAIPLPSAEVVRRVPMIARLLEQFGVALEQLVTLQERIELAIEPMAEGFEAFHIAQAEGSPFIPAQAEFVKPHGVRSVLGMGGVLPEGELFAVLLFTRVPLTAEMAGRLRPLALRVRAALQVFGAEATFHHRDRGDELPPSRHA